VDDIYAKDLALFFNEMLRSEKDPRMKVEIEEAVGDLAKRDEMSESLSLEF